MRNSSSGQGATDGPRRGELARKNGRCPARTGFRAFDPKVEFRLPPEWPDEEAGTGHDAALASMKATLELVDDLEITIHEIRELERDRLLVIGHVVRKAPEAACPSISTLRPADRRDGRIVRSEIFLDRGQALEAARLPECRRWSNEPAELQYRPDRSATENDVEHGQLAVPAV